LSCYMEACMPHSYVLILFMLLASHLHAAPMELKPEQVKQDLGFAIREIIVIEPHAQCGETKCIVTYVGIPLRALIEYYYPEEWTGFSGDIHLIARDGYLGIIEADKTRKKDAYLVFARADAKPFLVDNNQQGERDVPLGPFYLVWDNIEDPGLQKMSSYGWPYQVDRIQLVSDSIYAGLVPSDASSSVQAGFAAFKTYCMGCHYVNDVGGRKVGAEMKLLVNGKTREDLRSWISDPQKVRPATTMPPLNRNLDHKERQHVIDQIVEYLGVL